MSKFLVLGAGFVAEPLVEYLTRRSENRVTVASHLLAESVALADKFSQANPIQADVTNLAEIQSLIAKHDVVVSLVPAPLHPTIAKACLAESKSMVTASYQTPEMLAFNQEAIDKNITILNEIGLDPGIDHLSAMKIIDQAHAKNEKVISFVSWCGGLPAPEDNNNPLGYKFSWAPKGVLMALLNEAVYLKSSSVETVAPDSLLTWAKPLNICDLQLEGYPNRESVSYQNSYGIPEAKDILRGTLRYQGFCGIIQAARSIGLLNIDASIDSDNLSWSEYILKINQQSDIAQLKAGISEKPLQGLEWIGCFSEAKVGSFKHPIDAFCELLKQKLVYTEQEKDMVILQHKFAIEKSDGNLYQVSSTLKAIGDNKGYSAMSKTVGYPAAIASQLMADNLIDRKGVILPVTKDIYSPVLASLEAEGISCEEQELEFDPSFLKELD